MLQLYINKQHAHSDMWSSGGAWHASMPAYALPLFWATQQLYYYVWYLDKMPMVCIKYVYIGGAGLLGGRGSTYNRPPHTPNQPIYIHHPNQPPIHHPPTTPTPPLLLLPPQSPTHQPPNQHQQTK